MSSHTTLRTGVSLAAATLLLGACSAAPTATRAPTTGGAVTTDASTTSAPSAVSGAAVSGRASGPAWATSGLRPVAQVVKAGTTAVLVARSGSELVVVGLDPATGKEAWRVPTTHSRVLTGITAHVGVIRDRYVGVLSPLSPSSTSQYATLSIIDARTGKTVASSSDMRFVSYPRACDDDPEWLCIEAGDNGTATYRFAPDEVNLTKGAGGWHGYGETIGGHGLMRASGATLKILRVAGTEVAWTREERDLVGAGYSTNGGWAFRYDEKRRLFVGTVGRDRDGVPAVGATESLRDHTTTVAFTEAGEPLWRRPGIDLTRVPDLAPTGPDSSSNPLVAVEYTGGTATFKGVDASPRTTVRDVSIALVRLDPASGRNLWRVDLGRQALTTLADGLPLELTPTGLSAQSEKSPVVVDLASGSSRPAAAATVTWRRESVRYTGLVPYDSPAGALLERHGEVWQPRRQGQPIADLGSLGGPLPDAVGEQFGPLRLVSLSESVVAVRTG